MDSEARALAGADATRRLDRLPREPRHLEPGHGSHGAELEHFPFVAAFAYTQDETDWYADLLLPRGHRPRVAPALSDRRHRVRRAVLGAHGLGNPPACGRAPLRHAGPDGHRHRARRAHRLARAVPRTPSTGATPPRCRSPAKGYDFSFETLARPDGRGDLGSRVPCRHRVVERGHGRARSRVVQAPRCLRRPVSRPSGPSCTRRWWRRGSATSCPIGSIKGWRELVKELQERGITGGNSSSTSTRQCRRGRTSHGWGRRPRRARRTPEKFPFWLLTSHTMQDSWGSERVPPCAGRRGAPRRTATSA